jgi:hypothetical protein
MKPQKQTVRLQIDVDLLVKDGGSADLHRKIGVAFNQKNLRRSLDNLVRQAVPSTVVGVAITDISTTGETK